MNLLFEIALKSVGLIAFVSMIVRLLRGASAALRHRVWVLGFVGLALLPVLASRLPEIRIERSVASSNHVRSDLRPVADLTFSSSAASGIRPGASVARPLRRQISQETSIGSATPKQPPSPDSSSGIPELLIVVWGVGVAVLLFRSGLQLGVVAGLARRGQDLSLHCGLPAHTRLVQTAAVNVPMTFGFLRPTVLLPADSAEWPEERLRAVLLHEGAHVRRGDWAWLVLARVVGAVYWPNLFILWAASRLRAESELAADEAVLQAGVDASTYAATLVELASMLRGKRIGAALPFVEPGSLKARVAAILTGQGRRKPLGRTVSNFALLLCLAFVMPYAAVRIVAGPEVIHDGVLDVGEGHRLEMIAITDMRDGHAESWDVHGALLRRPFPIGESVIKSFQFMKPAPPGVEVRYVVFRLDDPNAYCPQFTTSSGDGLLVQPYSADPEGFASSFQDALGGGYRVVRLTLPPGARAANLSAKIPAADWKLVASQDYREGQMTGQFNPTLGIHIAPKMPGYGAGTEASFVLPPESADLETGVRFLPDDGGTHYFQGSTGPMTASTSVPPEKVQRVEIMTRPIRQVILAGLPMTPDPKAAYVPHHFLPEVAVTANHGIAQLPDGSTLRVGSVWNSDYPFKPVRDRSGKWITLTPSGTFGGKTPPEHWLVMSMLRLPSRPSGPNVLYDGEGFPVFRAFSINFRPDAEEEDFSAAPAGTMRQLDLATPVSLGPYRTIYRFERGKTDGATWSVAEQKGWSGSLRLNYPIEFEASVAGMDHELVPVDRDGKQVVRREGVTSASSSGCVEFNLSAKEAARVTAVELRARPYTWVRFPNVSLDAPRHGL